MVTFNRKRIVSGLFAVLSIFVLTGCVKGEVSLDIHEDGSCTYGVSIGMNRQAIALLSDTTGNDLLSQVQQQIDTRNSSTQVTDVTRWYEGDYEWVKAQKLVSDLDEVNGIFVTSQLAKSFSLTNKKGFLLNEFILDAELNPLFKDAPYIGNIQVDPTSFVQMNFAVRLPGEIKETNGSRNINDPNLMVWSMDGSRSVSIHARSIVWNWVNIWVSAGLVFIWFLILLVFLGLIGYKLLQRKKLPAPTGQVAQ